MLERLAGHRHPDRPRRAVADEVLVLDVDEPPGAQDRAQPDVLDGHFPRGHHAPVPAPEHAIEGLADPHEVVPADRRHGVVERPAQRVAAVDVTITRSRPPPAQEDAQQRPRGRPAEPAMDIVERDALLALGSRAGATGPVPAHVRPVRAVCGRRGRQLVPEPVGVDVDTAAQRDEALRTLNHDKLLVVRFGGGEPAPGILLGITVGNLVESRDRRVVQLGVPWVDQARGVPHEHPDLDPALGGPGEQVQQAGIGAS